MRKQYGFTGDRWSPFFQRRSTSGMEVERPLLTAEEMLLFALNKLAIFPMGWPRIQGDKLDFLHEKWLQQRCIPPPPYLLPYEESEEDTEVSPVAPAPAPPSPAAPAPSGSERLKT